MILNFNEYKNKVLGCWWGKYAGGTLGAPLEGRRGVFDVSGYLQDDPSGVPNDDVDLQLISLRACENYYNRVNSHILGEYWLTYLAASISEYGAAKNNLRNHVLPPISGAINNPCKNSNAAFIRSEIWACLCAANPEIAVRYALEDAMIDHVEEGIYGEIFCAACESIAFICDDVFEIIAKALTFIPENSDTYKAINIVIDDYKNGKTWEEARYDVLKNVPGSFGVSYCSEKLSLEDEKLPKAKDFYDAPSNVALGIIGVVYGEKDFGKTICIATNCGEDTDCTAGFAGALIGIILGYNNIPNYWLKPLSNKIVTCCLAERDDAYYPKTIDELANRILKLTPLFLDGACDIFAENGYSIRTLSDAELLRLDIIRQAGYIDLHNYPIKLKPRFSKCLEKVGKTLSLSFRNLLFDTIVEYVDSYETKNTSKIKVSFWSNLYEQQQLKVRMFMPIGCTSDAPLNFTVFLDQVHGGYNEATRELTFTFDNCTDSIVEVVMEVESVGRLNKVFIPIQFQLK